LSSYLLALLVAALAGSAMAFQGSLNAVLGEKIGLLEATLVVHLVGLVALGALFAFQLGQGGLQNLSNTPWYTFLGGILGVVIIFTVAASIPRAGVANATTAIIVAQLGSAMVIDNCGWFGLEVIPFNWYKLAGLVLLAVGGYLMLGAGTD